jgi:hypothetical protein
MLKIPGYKFPAFRRDRVGKMGGGVVGIKLLTVVEVELILPKLLDKSESEGPGFISIPDIKRPYQL